MAEPTKKMQTPLVEFPADELAALIRSFTPERLASFLDVTDLKADTQLPKMQKMADWAISLGCASVCVNPVEAGDILPKLLKGSKVKDCYVIDFPLGKLPIEQKAQQAADTIKRSREIREEGKGKVEVDMVINVGRFKKDPSYTLGEIDAICDAADGELVKVIIRSSELTALEIYKVSEIFVQSKAAFIKNSTGMDAFGATPEHLRIMREVVGKDRGVKASGGISDALTAMRLFYAAAKEPELQNPLRFRIGTSGPLAIVSSMSWLLHNTDDWVKAGVIPCTICPYHQNEKLRVEMREEANAHCRECKYRDYRKHKEF